MKTASRSSDHLLPSSSRITPPLTNWLSQPICNARRVLRCLSNLMLHTRACVCVRGAVDVRLLEEPRVMIDGRLMRSQVQPARELKLL